MTDKQRADIARLREKGMQLSAIAKKLDLPIGTVKTAVYRYPSSKAAKDSGCLQCGKAVMQTPHRKEKKFCCDACRMKWWNTHQDQVNRKAVYHFTCASCGKFFDSYGNSHRKYCCTACYNAYRSKEAAHE